jgi:mono/diheme cytochrome c family protein
MKAIILTIACGALLIACANTDYYNPLEDYQEVNAATNLDMPTPSVVTAEDKELVAHGEYLVELLGCGSCHTDGALIGIPDMSRTLAGSSVGIAYTNPLGNKNPGVVFPKNLTSDRETGLGLWTDEQITTAIQAGAGRHGPRRILVMPWQHYTKISAQDIRSIVKYLRSLDPVAHQVPNPIAEGTKSRHPFVHFGVYQSRDF